MAKLPVVSGTEAVKALKRLGFFIDRQRGSHAVLKKVTPQGERGCVIPMHREVALGTLRSALKWQACRQKNSPTPCDTTEFFPIGVK
jgi:predicted RNA binding protein YcfA (HicA-like mRNA interferase family)